MSKSAAEKQPITFSPGLTAEDPLGRYWLEQVTVRLRREVLWCWYERGAITAPEPGTLPPFTNKAEESLNLARFREEKNNFFHKDQTARYLTDQLEGGPPSACACARQGSFGWVVKNLGLDDVSSFALALSLSAAYDNAVGSVISACQNDATKTRPSLALAQRLWDSPVEVSALTDPAHRLYSHGLMQYCRLMPDNTAMVEWDIPIKTSSLLARQLLFTDSPLPSALERIEGLDAVGKKYTESDYPIVSRLNATRGQRLCIIPVCGQSGSDYLEMVKILACLSGKEVVEFKGDPSLLGNSDYLSSLAAICWLRGVDLYLGPETQKVINDNGKLALPLRLPIAFFLATTDRLQKEALPENFLMPAVLVPGLSYHERIAWWKKKLGKSSRGLEKTLAKCSRRFRYEKKTISDISEGLLSLKKPIKGNDIVQACRSELELDISGLAERVTPRFEGEKLILPRRQRLLFEEIQKGMKSLAEVHYSWDTGRVWNECGISVCFAGPPGTGKTMGAEVLGLNLGLPLWRVDLSQIADKYVGETEKRLKKLFDAADLSDIILFFDEAEAVFSKRVEAKSHHDFYHTNQIAYLLDRMERFKGLTILATNRKQDLDEALFRRLRYIIDFPLPDYAQRKKIWEQVMPPKIDTADIDLDFLAKQFQLSGGHIRSIVFNACLQSAKGSKFSNGSFRGKLKMSALIVSTKNELDKLNRPVSLEEFGPYAAIVEEMERADEEYTN